MFDDTLHFLANHLESPDWRRLGEHLPFEWIEQAVKRTDTTSIRHRRLPAEQVVWLMVALALYRHKSIGEVLDDLGLALPDSQTPFVSKSAAAQARQRLGSEPLKWLFDHSARHWSGQDRRAYIFKGLQLFAMDGTTLRTHETAENRDHFGAQLYSSGAIASYPQVRGVTLTALPTHIVHSAAFGPYGTNEMLYGVVSPNRRNLSSLVTSRPHCAVLLQRRNQRAGNVSLPCMTGAHKFGQHGFHARQVGHLFAHVLKLVLGQAAGFIAMSTIVQPEQFSNFVQAKAKPLGRFHKPHPRHIRFAIPANAAVRLIWLR
jgi:hypothetical protein